MSKRKITENFLDAGAREVNGFCHRQNNHLIRDLRM